LERGKDYVLPGDGDLKFDQNPGIEKLSLLLSRSPIDTTAYVSPTDSTAPHVVARIASGSKDLIPSQILVSYVQPSPLPKATSGVEAPSSQSAKKSNASAPATTKDMAVKHRHRIISSQRQADVSNKTSLESGITTVVYKDPSGVLAVDVSLEHL